jgi:hypothetical protein
MSLWFPSPAFGVSCPVDEDMDGNGFRDKFEQMLIVKFCPSLALPSIRYGVETTPEPVEIMTGSLWRDLFYISDGAYNGEQEVSNLLSGNYSNLDNDKEYQAPPVQTYNCGTSSQSWTNYHFEYAGLSLNCDALGEFYESRQGWYEVYANGRWDINPPIQPGSSYPLTIYAHLFRASSGYVIQYWLFYPFNDWVAKHEGDWEHINVLVSSDDPNVATISKVVYWFHKSFVNCDVSQLQNPTDFEYYVTDDTHPVAFVGGYSETSYFGTVGDGQASHGSFPRPAGWPIVLVDWSVLTWNFTEFVDGDGSWIPWTEFVSATADEKYGLVLLKEPDDYDYDEHPEMSWLKADIQWGHRRVASQGTAQSFVDCHNNSPRGPAHQFTWNNLDQGNDEFTYYTYSPNTSGYDDWVAGVTSSGPSRDLIISPDANSMVSGVVEITGTASYADKELVVDWASATTPDIWSCPFHLFHPRRITALDSVPVAWDMTR